MSPPIAEQLPGEERRIQAGVVLLLRNPVLCAVDERPVYWISKMPPCIAAQRESGVLMAQYTHYPFVCEDKKPWSANLAPSQRSSQELR